MEIREVSRRDWDDEGDCGRSRPQGGAGCGVRRPNGPHGEGRERPGHSKDDRPRGSVVWVDELEKHACAQGDAGAGKAPARE